MFISLSLIVLEANDCVDTKLCVKVKTISCKHNSTRKKAVKIQYCYIFVRAL